MRKFLLTLACVMVFLQACDAPKEPKVNTNEISTETKKANEFFERVFSERIDRSPQFQTSLGIKKDYSSWDDPSDEARLNELEITKKELETLKSTINYDALDEQTKISYDLFVLQSDNEITDFKYRYHAYPVNQMFGFHSEIPSFLINMHLIADKSDAEAYVARLKGVKDLFEKAIKELSIGEGKGILPPKFVFGRVLDDSKNIISGKPFDKSKKESALMADFAKKVKALDIPDSEKEELKSSAETALREFVKPAYAGLIEFLKGQQERATADDGAWKFPDGENFYNNALARTTTTKMTAEEIHELGLTEVARIHGEMKDIMKQVNFKGSLQDFFKFMREDGQFYYANTDAEKEIYMDSATQIIDNMKGLLDKLFLTKPKADMTVKRVEAFREQSAGKAFYNQPAPDGSRPGIYYANLHNTKNMPKYEMEALAYHEGIPGHHMQIAIAQELQGIPNFRKFGGFTAYVEGWGLYCEKIPKEIGLYSNPYSDFGRLAMELWRSCRLVVDTGIHNKKWTREEGIKYYMENTSGSERECVRMVERHIVIPSQATAYKIGMNKILELREGAKAQLGDKFDIKEFHDVILTSGAVPLNLLEKMVDEWVTAKMN